MIHPPTAWPQTQLQAVDCDPGGPGVPTGTDGLMWYPEGYGFLPLGSLDEPEEYGAAYWQKYQDYKGTPLERGINDLRAELVQKWHPEGGLVLDVGIGNGSFLDRIRSQEVLAAGYDVNPLAVEWLRERGVYHNILSGPATSVSSVTLWDVLEHIEDPTDVLACASCFVFLCMPIYQGPLHVLASKHYRPGEHCWYFTEVGLRRFLAVHGFKLVDMNHLETFAGREGIGSFVFERSD